MTTTPAPAYKMHLEPKASVIAGAILAVFALHGLAGYALSQMEIKAIVIPPPEPIEIELLKTPEPEPEVVELIIADSPSISPSPSVAAPTPAAQSAHQLDNQPISEPADSAAPETPEQAAQPEILKDTPDTPETQQETQQETPQETPKEPLDSTAEQQALEAARARAAAQAQRQANTAQGTGNNNNNNNNNNNSNPPSNKTPSIPTGGDSYTITNANASWKSKPNLRFNNGHEYTPKTTTISVTLAVDASGKITSANPSSTGDKALDREIARRIRQASLNPFSVNGRAQAGKGTVTLALSGFNVRTPSTKDTKKDKQNSANAVPSAAKSEAPKADTPPAASPAPNGDDGAGE